MNGNNKNYNSNERDFPWPVGHEPTEEEVEKYFKEATGIDLSFHWEYIGGEKKKGVLTPIKKNIEILTGLEKSLKAVAGEGPVNFQIEDPDRKLIEVSKEEFANWMIEDKEEKNIKTPPKESLVYGASGDIDGTTVFTERKGKDEFFRESYYQPRNEEEKKQIIERNRKRREEEKLQEKNSSINTDEESEKIKSESDKENHKLEKEEINQSNSFQGKDNNSNKTIYWSIGIFSLLGLVGIIAIRKIKKYKK